MRISPISSTYNYQKPSFRSLSCDYKLNGEEMGLYTWMFREDINWTELAKYEAENFKYKDKVNIIQFAPSDGSEGYTKILSLLRYSPGYAEKFFPIKAYDINQAVVDAAKLGCINLNVVDVERIVLENRINADKYFPGSLDYYIKNKENKRAMPKTFKVSDELTKRIQFNQGDMFKILPKIQDDSNTVILARNSIGYYDWQIRCSFFAQAADILKKDSLFVVGKLEGDVEIRVIMRKLGFEEVLKNVFRKVR